VADGGIDLSKVIQQLRYDIAKTHLPGALRPSDVRHRLA
jgi:hypothetical protein